LLILPSALPSSEKQRSPTFHVTVLSFVREKSRPRAVVPESCATQCSERDEPFAVIVAVACQSTVALLIVRSVPVRSSVSVLPFSVYLAVMAPLIFARPSGPVHPLKAYVAVDAAESSVTVRQPRGMKNAFAPSPMPSKWSLSSTRRRGRDCCSCRR